MIQTQTRYEHQRKLLLPLRVIVSAWCVIALAVYLDPPPQPSPPEGVRVRVRSSVRVGARMGVRVGVPVGVRVRV